jgi:hypothetical protein
MFFFNDVLIHLVVTGLGGIDLCQQENSGDIERPQRLDR